MMRASGFSLIELMIGLAILAIVLMRGVPLTQTWFDQAKARELTAAVKEGVGKARALALRNIQGVSSGSSATLCASNGNLYVHEGVPASCGVSALWQSVVPSGFALRTQKSPAISFVCMQFDSAGLPASSTLGGSSCFTGNQMFAIKGSVDETITVP